MIQTEKPFHVNWPLLATISSAVIGVAFGLYFSTGGKIEQATRENESLYNYTVPSTIRYQGKAQTSKDKESIPNAKKSITTKNSDTGRAHRRPFTNSRFDDKLSVEISSVQKQVPADGRDLSTHEQNRLREQVTQLVEASTQQQWSKFMEYSEKLSQSGTELLDLTLQQAIAGNAPLHVLVELLHMGAQLDDNTIFILAARNDVRTTEALLRFGLNLYARDVKGLNAVHYSVAGSGYIVEFLDFLARHNVDINIDNEGPDPLQIALNRYGDYHYEHYIAAKLIHFGATLKPHHLAYIRKLAAADPHRYDNLISAIPDLSI